MLGLALSIDYSLFIVSRFREELRRGRTVGEAVEKAIATSGKAVAFSGFAVAVGLSGLLLFSATGDQQHRHRRDARRPELAVLRADVPAGRPGHARPSDRRPQRRRRSCAAWAGGARARRPQPLGARRDRGHAPPDRRARPGARRAASSSARRSSGSSRACRARRSTPPAWRAGMPTSRSRQEFASRRDHADHGRRDDPRRPDEPGHRARARPLRGAARGDARRRPRRERLQPDRPDDRHGLPPEQIAAFYAMPRRPAAGAGRRRPWPPSRRRTSGAGPSAST